MNRHPASFLFHNRILLALLFAFSTCAAFSQPAPFRVLAVYATQVEPDHATFALQAVDFFQSLAKKDNFQFDTATSFDSLDAKTLRQYQVVLWLNDAPHNQQQREAFREYMTHGGAWMGFHASAFNDSGTHWPWFVDFLGGAVFSGNNWPPLPARLTLDDPAHPVARNLPASFTSPANEWYIWNPSPRLHKNVKVLATLDRANYPIGLKDTVTAGDLPVVWTNTDYKMIYMNMGHGDKIFTVPEQNVLFENALLWLGGRH